MRYLRIKEAAERAGVHEFTIRRWIASGLLPAYRQGNRLIKIRQEDLDAMLKPIEPDAA